MVLEFDNMRFLSQRPIPTWANFNKFPTSSGHFGILNPAVALKPRSAMWALMIWPFWPIDTSFFRDFSHKITLQNHPKAQKFWMNLDRIRITSFGWKKMPSNKKFLGNSSAFWAMQTPSDNQKIMYYPKDLGPSNGRVNESVLCRGVFRSSK